MPETARLRMQPGPPGREVGRWSLLGLYAAFFCTALVPIAAFDLLPLADLPNHLARVHILLDLGHSSDLQKYYAIAWHVPSFQSIDFLMPPLASWFGLFPAARLYVAVAFLLLVGGTCALHRVLFGHVGWWPLVSVLLLHDYLFAWGFVSYLFATGLVLLMFAAWIALRHKPVWMRLLVFVPATLFLLLCHLFGLVCYGILVAVYEFRRLGTEPDHGAAALRRLAVAGVQFLVPFALLLHAWSGSIPSVTFFGGVADVARAALSPFAMYLGWPELVVLAAMLVALLFYGRRHMLRFSATMRLPIAILLLLAALTPASLSGVWSADTRLPCLLAFLVVAASDLDLETPRRRAGFAGLIALLLLLRVGYIVETWRGFTADYTEYRQIAGGIARGSRVLVFHPEVGLFAESHVAAFSVIDRDVFLPHLFTSAQPLVFIQDRRDITANLREKHQPVVWSPVAPAFAGADAETIREVETLGEIGRSNDAFLSAVDWSHWPENFDYLVAYNDGARGNPVPALLTEIGRGSFFTIYRIHPPAPL